MTLHRLKLRPRSPWRTPWQADTLTGMLLAHAARVHGGDFLRQRLIEPMQAGAPPFVLSDACPGDLLPAPIVIRLQQWPSEYWKSIKRARWTTRDGYERLGRIQPVELIDGLYTDDDLFLQHARYHNTLSRLTDTTGEAESGLGPFNRPDFHLRSSSHVADTSESPHDPPHLSVYFRASDENATALLLELFQELSLTGFGADTATGRGQFDLVGDPEVVPETDLSDANAIVCLSTFQPAARDPTEGYWESFPKFGKLGPDFGLANDMTFKNTLIMFRPGACFRTPAPRPWIGRAIPMDQLLPPRAATELQQRGVNVIHPAFGLCLSTQISWETLE